MGCGKSKHAVETATTVVRSTKSDGGKETHITTKTVTEKGDASLVQHQVETKSLVDEDSKKETTTTKVDTSGVANTDNVAPASGDNVGKVAEVVKEDEKVKDTNPTQVNDATTENVVPTSSKDDVGATKVVKEEEKKEANLVTNNEAKLDKVSPTPSKDDVGVTEVVNEDKEKKEPNQITHNEIKIDNVSPIEVIETKESNLTKDNNVKTEFMTPRTGEDVVEAMEVVKDDAKVKDTKEENIESVISSAKSVKTIDDSLNFKNTSPKVEEQKVVVPAVESAEVKPTEEDNVKVTKANLANVETSIATEPEKVSRLNEASVAETPERKP